MSQDFLECSYSIFLADWLKNIKIWLQCWCDFNPKFLECSYSVFLEFIILRQKKCVFYSSLARRDLPFLSAISPGRSSRLYQLRVPQCTSSLDDNIVAFMYRRKAFRSSFLLFQQCTAWFVRLTLMVCEVVDKWPNSWWNIKSCFQDMEKEVWCIFVNISSSLCSMICVGVLVIYRYSRNDTTRPLK